MIKVVFVGDTQVGKTCIISRLTSGSFKSTNPATIGAAFQTHVMTTPQGTVTMQIWDTAGQEKYRALAPMYYRSADVAVLCFDVTNQASYEAMEQWSNELAEKAPQRMQLIICGNKIDDIDHRVISKDAGEQHAMRHGAKAYIETSAKTGEGIVELFTKAAELASDADIASTKPKTKKLEENEEKPKGCC
ncbi:small GTP-binding protein [Tritrichomonas foetus]|uniref:Small GTP-binding protein n=1 Tax=Tritrichomonas foetus TaxID=1144522 RepID=A0A1J4JYF2_9EUKA|nr:small GTP-binding protein [Tritrichomonas foetus]|eukprot:OHT02301.1 small GTP-binding protein [Tritrichomonas foetus]